MELSIFIEYWPLLLSGLIFTLKVCSSSLIMGLLLGIFLYLFSTIKNRLTFMIYRAYLTIFRGTPLLVQVYLIFYGGPLLGITLSAAEVGILGMGLYVAAYFSEIYRSGFNSLPKGQIEAAQNLGFSKRQILTHIQLPQILGLIVPSLTNQSIILIKESAILSIISVPEITYAAVKMASETYSVVEPYIFLAGAYWVINFVVSRFGNWVELKSTHYLATN